MGLKSLKRVAFYCRKKRKQSFQVRVCMRTRKLQNPSWYSNSQMHCRFFNTELPTGGKFLEIILTSFHWNTMYHNLPHTYSSTPIQEYYYPPSCPSYIFRKHSQGPRWNKEQRDYYKHSFPA